MATAEAVQVLLLLLLAVPLWRHLACLWWTLASSSSAALKK
jgi:hypothetical protein